MNEARADRVMAALSADDGGAPLDLGRVCLACIDLVGVTGCGLTLMTGESREAVYFTDDVTSEIEELQFTVGEGPCIDAYTGRAPVLEPDLAAPDLPRWVAFARAATKAGARAVFAFPLQVGVARIGTIDLYRDQPGMLSQDQLADALILTDLAAEIVLSLQAQVPPGALHSQLIDTRSPHGARVHHATGMVSAQLGVSVAEALVRLRAHAFASGRPLSGVALDVVARRLRFDPEK